ncbi:MAG TPA: trypsin-like serine protease [bacterium]|nr:trypsin-like serine protease [bacterium]
MKITSKILFLLCLVSTGLITCSGNGGLESLEDILPPASTASQTSKPIDDFQNEIFHSRQNAITRAVNSASDAVVGINVTQIQRYVQGSPFFDDPWLRLFFPPREYERRVQGLGSGFLISPDGYILTNEHVVHNASDIVVTTTDGKQYKARIAGQDMTYDVALLKIEGEQFPFIPLGSSDDIIIGEWVIALGNPFGLFNVNSKPIVTVGVISAVNMDFSGSYQDRLYKDMIQTDAAINGGNSGGPLLNSLGQCIGINTFIFTERNYSKGSIGLGFAIPINRVKTILPDLKNIGRVDRAFRTGLEVENLGPLEARSLGISRNDGVIVTLVNKDSPASRAGIRRGDVIVAVNSHRIRSTSDIQNVIQRVDLNESSIMTLDIFRDGKLIQVKLELEWVTDEK